MDKTKTLRDYADDYIAFKRSGGGKAYKEAQTLNRFVTLAEGSFPEATTVTKELAEFWADASPNEKATNQQHRKGALDRFSKYLMSHGVEAYLYLRARCVGTDFVPHIFTNEELSRLFTACDNTRTPNTTRSEVVSLLFRMLYATGMRVSEALDLKIRDVDLVQGIIRLYDTKFGKERFLPVDDALLAKMKRYARKNLAFLEKDSPFFPGPKGRHYAAGSVYHMFRQCLRDAKIPHGGKGAGPRVHDLRHTFAVHCLRRAVKNGDDLTVMLKYLSVYLGHVDIFSTQTYLRLTADMYPNVVCQMEKNFDVMPDLEVLYEAY
jgi:integrase